MIHRQIPGRLDLNRNSLPNPHLVSINRNPKAIDPNPSLPKTLGIPKEVIPSPLPLAPVTHLLHVSKAAAPPLAHERPEPEHVEVCPVVAQRAVTRLAAVVVRRGRRVGFGSGSGFGFGEVTGLRRWGNGRGSRIGAVSGLDVDGVAGGGGGGTWAAVGEGDVVTALVGVGVVLVEVGVVIGAVVVGGGHGGGEDKGGEGKGGGLGLVGGFELRARGI